MNFTDATGQGIDIGDIILFTMSTDGSAARMQAGKVTRFTAKSIWVQPHEIGSLTPKMVDEFYLEDDGPPIVYDAGTSNEWTHQPTRRVVTGKEEIGEKMIPKPVPYRFYVIRKV